MPRTQTLAEPAPPALLTRRRGKHLVIYAATIVGLYLCYQLAQPFLPAEVFATTIAIITQPLIRWFERRISSVFIRAAAAVVTVTVALLVPIVVTVYFVARQLAQSVELWPTYLDKWQQYVERESWLAPYWDSASRNLNITGAIEQLAGMVNSAAMAIATASVHSIFQALVMLYILFFLYRDRDSFLKVLTKLSPLTTPETNQLLKRLGDTVRGTVFGVIAVAILQGALGGFILWLLGIPGAVLWATAMALLAMVPNLGTFVIWAPAALLLFLDGSWVKAIVLSSWGLTAIALIDNLLYPYLVGNRLREHTVIIFLAILGGISFFGPAGIILGPVVVNLTIFLLELWRRRTEPFGPKEEQLTL